MATIKAGLGGDYIYVATSGRGGASGLYTDSGWFTGAALRQGYCEEAEGFRLGIHAGVVYVSDSEGQVYEEFTSLNLARKEFTRLVKVSLVWSLWATAKKAEKAAAAK